MFNWPEVHTDLTSYKIHILDKKEAIKMENSLINFLWHNYTRKPTTQLFFIALSAICLPFVTPALRRVCLPYVPATTTQLENIQSALKYHGSKPGTRSKLVDIGNFLN